MTRPRGHRKADNHVAVIGGGIIGVCAATCLLRDGMTVTLVEQEDIAGGASFGNAGCFNQSSIVPVSMPGNLLKVPGWLLDPLGPLAIRWSYLPSILPWLVKFIRAGSTERVFEQARALAPLLLDSVGAYEPLTRNAGAQELIKRDGHLMAYRNQAAFQADALAWRLRRENNIPYVELEGDALWEHEPALSRNYSFGILLADNGHTVSPKHFVSALAAAFTRDGGRIIRNKASSFEFREDSLVGVRTDAGLLNAGYAVIAAGAHSRFFTAQLGDSIPLDTERGYHVVITAPEVLPRIPIMDMEGKFVATPMNDGLRIAGTVEFAGLRAKPNWKRAHKLLTLGKRLLPALAEHYPEDRLSRWMGFRPSMPDSLPVIGHSRRSRDVIYAFGHGHVGMAAGARTGLLVSDLLAGRTPRIPVEPFSPRRFG